MYQAAGIHKRFGGVVALDGVDFELRPGSVHALLGANGAGKSTLVRILAGALTPDQGRLTLGGRPVRLGSTRQAARLGVAVVSQELSLFPDLDVLANLFPTYGLRRGGVLVDRRAMEARARPVLDELELDRPSSARVADLTLAERQLVEIARALLSDPAVLVLDEPTSALASDAVARLVTILRALRVRDVGVVYVSHILDEVMQLCDTVTVLRDGRNALTAAARSGLTIPQIVTAMIGEAPAPAAGQAPDTAGQPPAPPPGDREPQGARHVPPPEAHESPETSGGPPPEGSEPRAVRSAPPPADGQVPQTRGVPPDTAPRHGGDHDAGADRDADKNRDRNRDKDGDGGRGRGDGGRGRGDGATGPLTLRGVTVPGVLEGVDLRAAPGEIVGCAGLAGAGQAAVLEVVCGLRAPQQGTVTLPGARPRPRHLRGAVRAGVAVIPSDRRRLGLMLDVPVWENIMQVSAAALGRGGLLLRRRALRRRAAWYIGRLGLRVTSVDQRTGQLSGGNQQKVVFAKWLEAAPSVVLLDDPTRGVDVSAKAEMHQLIRGLAAEGRVLLLTSTDLGELVELCDRVVVLRRGRVCAELSGDELTEPELLHLVTTGERRGVAG